jgi:hypothetical protein
VFSREILLNWFVIDPGYATENEYRRVLTWPDERRNLRRVTVSFDVVPEDIIP